MQLIKLGLNIAWKTSLKSIACKKQILTFNYFPKKKYTEGQFYNYFCIIKDCHSRYYHLENSMKIRESILYMILNNYEFFQ